MITTTAQWRSNIHEQGVPVTSIAQSSLRNAVLATVAKLAAALAASSAVAAPVVIAATSVTTNMGTTIGTSLAALIDQSGLSQAYTSGVTDFSTYAATTTHDSGQGVNLWASATVPVGILTFDLGASYLIDGLALWNLQTSAPATLRRFNLFADSDNDFFNGTTTNLGTFAPPDQGPTPVGSDVFTFGGFNTRYLHMQITANDGAEITGFGEVIFRQDVVQAVPEPGVASLALLALVALGVSRQRRAAR